MKLTVNGMEFSYGRNQILKSVDLSLEKGEVFGILGPNGSGKTTLIKCINRILTPSQGKIFLNSDSVLDMKIRDVAKCMGYVPQNATNEFSAPTVYEVVMMGRYPHSSAWQKNSSDESAVWDALNEMEVSDLASRPFNRLSSGQTQRVLMARALAQEAKVLLLDEPTSNLDLRYQIDVMDTVKDLTNRKGVGVFAIIHDMDIALRYCDKAVMLDKGEITAAGDILDVLTPENIMRTYGVEVAIDRNYGRPHIIVI